MQRSFRQPVERFRAGEWENWVLSSEPHACIYDITQSFPRVVSKGGQTRRLIYSWIFLLIYNDQVDKKMRKRKKLNEREQDDLTGGIRWSHVWDPRPKRCSLNGRYIFLVDRTHMSPFRVLTNGWAIYGAQRQAGEGEVGTEPEIRLCITSGHLPKAVVGTQSTFLYIVQRWPLEVGEALSTAVKLHRVYLHRCERGSCFLFKAETAGALMKVTFMLSHHCPHFWDSETIPKCQKQ